MVEGVQQGSVLVGTFFSTGFGFTPPIPGWGLWCVSVCVCFGLSLRFNREILAGMLGCVCWYARCISTPPILAGVWDVAACAWVRVLASPCPSWLGC